MLKTAVALMARYPEPGKVKTRLASAVGEQEACRVYLNLLDRIAAEVRSLNSTRFLRAAAVTPVSLCSQFATDFEGFDQVVPQVDGNLGQRMQGVIEQFTGSPAVRFCILVGADIPKLNRTLIEKAAKLLTRHDLVLGPTDDGGYYLIGMNRVYPELFSGMKWGSSTVLEQTMARAALSNLQVSTLEKLRDLDDVDDLEFFRSLSLGTL